MSIPEALVLSLLGFAVVFAVLVFLNIIIQLLSRFARFLEQRNAVVTVAPAVSAASAPPAPAASAQVPEAPVQAVSEAPAPPVQAASATVLSSVSVPLKTEPVRASGENASSRSEVSKYILTIEGSSYEITVADETYGATPVTPVKAPPVQQIPAAPPVKPVAQTIPAPAVVPVQVKGSSAPAEKNGGEVNSPLPGNILKVNVKEGDIVKAGHLLMILEAMKMENDIIAPRDGTVARVCAAAGTTVEAGSPLVILE